MRKLKTKILAGTLIAGTLVSNVAYANAMPKGVFRYDVTVGAFNGQASITAQRKTTGGQAVVVDSTSVGGDYRIDVQGKSRDDAFKTTSWYEIGDNMTARLSNKFNSGEYIRLVFSNDLTTPVRVQAIGSWTP